MNKIQADALKYATCCLIERLEPELESMASHGLPQKEADKIDEMIDYLYKLNKKYVRLSKK